MLSITQELKNYYELRRTKEDFYVWVDSVMESWTAHGESFHGKDQGRKKWQKSFSGGEKRIWDKFFSEVRPLRKLLEKTPRFCRVVKVQVWLDTSCPDASLTFSDESLLTLEITRPRDGHRESTQLQCLNEFGRVYSGLSVETYKAALGEKQSLLVNSAKFAIRREPEVFKDRLEQIQNGVKKKCSMSYAEDGSVELLVTYYDNDFFTIENIADLIIVPKNHPFRAIYLLGEHSRQVVELFSK